MRLWTLQEAAEALGYSVKGLRKIVDRSRARARGLRTRGPTIKFFQAGERSPIKFKSEWIEEFIAGNTVDPTPPAKKTKAPSRPPQKDCFAFDPALF
jgi:hypothetical protein